MEKTVSSRNWVVVGFGFAAALGLVVAVDLFSFRQSRGVESDITRLTHEAERSTYLIGASGHLLSRLQANVLEALTEDASALMDARQRFESVDNTLQQHMVELPGLLSAAEREAWHAIESDIYSLRQSLGRSLVLVEMGSGGEAEAELDVLARRTRQVFESLRLFLEFNQRETRMQLAAADSLLVRTRMVQEAIAMLLIIGISGIALLAIRAVRQKDRVIASSVEHLEQANRDLEAFAGRVAHDLRNVLAPLSSTAHLLQLSARRPDAVLNIAAHLGRVTRGAAELISGLLAFSRAGAPTSFTSANVNGELERVLEELEPTIASASATIEVDVHPELAVLCEGALLHIILLNLISNAVKFLEGRPVRQVRIAARVAGNNCVISVQDTGPGIPASARERIFEPFFRVPGATTSGTGIGLATVRRIVACHGGRIEVNSDEGKGSRFTVALPVVTTGPELSSASERTAKSFSSTARHSIVP